MNNLCCGPCVQKRLIKNPNAYVGMNIEWVTLLERAVPALCPACGPIYFGAKIVANSNGISDGVRNVAALICTGLLIFAGAKFVDELIA